MNSFFRFLNNLKLMIKKIDYFWLVMLIPFFLYVPLCFIPRTFPDVALFPRIIIGVCVVLFALLVSPDGFLSLIILDNDSTLQSRQEMETPGERLQQMRKELALTQESLAEKLHLSVDIIKEIESGNASISKSLAKSVFDQTGYHSVWLLKGKGIKKSAKTEGDSYADYTDTYLANLVEKTGIEIDEKEKAFLLNIIKKWFPDKKSK